MTIERSWHCKLVSFRVYSGGPSTPGVVAIPTYPTCKCPPGPNPAPPPLHMSILLERSTTTESPSPRGAASGLQLDAEDGLDPGLVPTAPSSRRIQRWLAVAATVIAIVVVAAELVRVGDGGSFLEATEDRQRPPSTRVADDEPTVGLPVPVSEEPSGPAATSGTTTTGLVESSTSTVEGVSPTTADGAQTTVASVAAASVTAAASVANPATPVTAVTASDATVTTPSSTVSPPSVAPTSPATTTESSGPAPTTTQPPSTEAPTTTQSPSTKAPTTQTPSTEAPTTQTTVPSTVPGLSGELIWEDNFNTFDSQQWAVEHSTYGDGNNELQCYRPRNVSVVDGKLTKWMHK